MSGRVRPGGRPTVRLGEAVLHLEASGAAIEPARGRLFVADLHLGKGSTLRAAGLPVPGGTSRETMHRVSDAIRATDVPIREVWVLGDLVHAATGLDDALVDEVGAWMRTLPGGGLNLVRGNHDAGAGELPRSWGLVQHADPCPLEAFDAAHVPPPPTVWAGSKQSPDARRRRGAEEPRATIAGHLHPMIRAGLRRTRSPKVPAFVGWGGPRSAPRVLVLPAQGRLVDGGVIRGRGAMVAWACVEGSVVAVPAGAW